MNLPGFAEMPELPERSDPTVSKALRPLFTEHDRTCIGMPAFDIFTEQDDPWPKVRVYCRGCGFDQTKRIE